ncbi:hypothetical protein MRBLMN1_003160 [Chitinophaga ginsengisegetis]
MMYNILEVTSPDSFYASLKGIGQGRTIYCRAFIVADSGQIIYESKTEKITAGGLTKLWEKEYTDGRIKEILQVLPTTDNAFIILAKMYDNTIAWPRLVKIDTSGNVQWDMQYHEHEQWTPTQLMKVKDGYILAATYQYLYTPRVAIVKLDVNGNRMWEKNIDINAMQRFVRFQLLKEDVFKVTVRTITGYSPNPLNPTFTDCWYDLQGNMLLEWSTPNYNKFNEGLYIYKMATAPDSSFMAANPYYYYNPPGSTNMTGDAILHYFDKKNQLRWERIYGKTGYDTPVSLEITSEGNFSILGYTNSYNNQTSLWLFQVDKTNGDVLWEQTYFNSKYGINGKVYPTSIYMGNHDQHYITGYVSDNDYGSSSAYILKVDERGNYIWDYTFEDSEMRYIQGEYIFVNTSREVYVFGTRKFDGDAPRSIYLTKWKEF